LQCADRQTWDQATAKRLPACSDGLIKLSNAAGLNVTEHVTGAAQENDAVAGGIRSIPFELVVRDFDFRSVGDVRPAERFVGPIVIDGRVSFAVSDMDFIGPIGISFAAA
jgi:hypothetical protein